MKAQAIVEHFLDRAPWVDRAHTVDRVVYGEAQADFDRCLVTWISSMRALRAAVARGIRLVITHEPTFYNHLDELPTAGAGLEKLEFIRAHGLTIIRNHDGWDRWPQLGMPWAWGRFLGFTTPPVCEGNKGYQHRYDMPPMRFGAFAREVARRCAAIGEPVVQAIGDENTPGSRIGVNTGCASDIAEFQSMGCDCAIVADDGSCYWSGLQRAADFGYPVIRVNHGTCEEPGMPLLADYINANLPGLAAEHFPHGPIFRPVGTPPNQPQKA